MGQGRRLDCHPWGGAAADRRGRGLQWKGGVGLPGGTAGSTHLGVLCGGVPDRLCVVLGGGGGRPWGGGDCEGPVSWGGGGGKSGRFATEALSVLGRLTPPGARTCSGIGEDVVDIVVLQMRGGKWSVRLRRLPLCSQVLLLPLVRPLHRRRWHVSHELFQNSVCRVSPARWPCKRVCGGTQRHPLWNIP